MLGSSMSIAGANFVLNTIVADTLQQFADELEKADDFNKAVKEVIKKAIQSIRELFLTVTDILMSGLQKLRNADFQMLNLW